MGVITITGKILLPDGNGPVGGHVVATLSANASVGSDRVVGRKIFIVPDGGDMALSDPTATIESNDGLTPAGTTYTADYFLRDQQGRIVAKTETWQLSGSGSQSIGAFAVDVPVPPIVFDDGAVPLEAALPTPDATYRGRFRRLKPAGRPEKLYVCLTNHDGTAFYWKFLVDGEDE